MYTVLRLTSAVGKVPELAHLIEEMNAGQARTRVEPRTKGDGYVAVVSDQPSWSEHAAAVLDFLEVNRDALMSARASGAIVSVDVAVEPEDRPDVPWLELTLSEALLAALSAVGARFVMSFYANRS